MDLGFTQLSVLFFRSNCVLVVYMDECLIFAPNYLSAKYILQDGGDNSAYLEVQVTKVLASNPT
jgi:hypothetical protein